MKSQKRFFAATAALLVFAGSTTLVRAQSEPSDIYFVEASGPAPAETATPAEARAAGAAIGGWDSRTSTLDLTTASGDTSFYLDVMYDVSRVTGGVSDTEFQIHFDSSKVEPVATGDMAGTGIFQGAFASSTNAVHYSRAGTPASDALKTTISAAGLVTVLTDSDTVREAANDSIMWTVVTDSAKVLQDVSRVVNLHMQWKDGAEGDTVMTILWDTNRLNFDASTARVQHLTINGPEVAQRANLTLEGTDSTAPNRNVQTTDQVPIAVTCNLTNADGSAVNAPSSGSTCSVVGTASVLGGAAGSATHASSPSDDTEYSGDDVTTAMEISIAAGSASGVTTFFITPNSADAVLQFDFSITEVGDHPLDGTAGDLVADQFSKASATFRVVNAAIQLTMANADGTCPATAGSVVATSPIEEGGDAVVVCATLVSDPDSDVAVACEADAAGQAASLGVSGGGTLSNANRAMGLPITMSIPDNNIDGGGGSAVVTCTGTGNAGTAYESVSSTISLTITDPDMVATSGNLTATSTVSEKGGIQMVAINAVIDAGPTPGTSCDVTVSVGTTTSQEATDNGGTIPATTSAGLAVAPDFPDGADITIAAQSLTGTAIMARVIPDREDNSAAIAAVTGPPTVPAIPAASATNNVEKEVIKWDGATTTCGRSSVVFASAFTIIVDKGTTEALQNVNYAVAPVATQFAVASAMNNIQARATASRSGADREAVFSLAGNTTTESVLMTHMKGAAAMDDANDYEYDWKKAFSNSSFSMPIFGAGGGTLWASGDYRTMNGDNGITDWEGNSFLWSFGADARLNNDMLVGLMLNISDTAVDYKENSLGTEAKGEYTLTGTSLRPYFAWQTGQTDIWGSLGFGTGEAEITTVDDSQTQDTSESSLSLGVKHALVEGLSVQADLSQITTDFDEKKDGDTTVAAQQEVTSQRARVLLVGENSYNSANGTITPKVEIGFRFDTSETDKASAVGDDEFTTREDSSTGTEAAMGVDVASAGRLMGLKARFYSGNDYDEWGISGIYEHHVGAGGLGLAMAMRPQYGNTASTTKSLFQQEFDNASNVKKTTVADAVNAPSMNSDISYGFAAPGDRGVITPYAKAVLGSNVATSSRLGMRWKPHSRFNVDVYGDNKAAADDYAMLLNWASKGPLDFALEGKRTEKAAGDISHSVVLKGTLDF